MNTSIIRQGDVLIVPIAETPVLATRVKAEGGRLILAHGEATGHHHSIRFSERVALFREDGSGGGLFLSVFGSKPVELEHQEHKVHWAASVFSITADGVTREFADGERLSTDTPQDRALLSAALSSDAPLRITGEPILPGAYEGRRQQEYSPAEIHRVED